MLLFFMQVDTQGAFWSQKKALNIDWGEGGDENMFFLVKIEKCLKSFGADCLNNIIWGTFSVLRN